MNIHWLQHVPFEGLGSIESWAGNAGHKITFTRLFEGDTLPGVEDIDWLIIMGGPMSVHDTEVYPWLIREKDFTKRAIDQGKTVLGICLGAQLIAHVLGAKVYSNREKEIGWFPIEKASFPGKMGIFDAIPDKIDVFHWHGETYELPSGAVRLASSAACKNQAFIYGEKVIGFQFHLEVLPNGVRDLIEHCGGEIVPAPYIQTADTMLSNEERFKTINKVMDSILDYLEKMGSGLHS